MTLLFMRHGQTEWNARRLIQGRTDIPLNATGREQACAQAAALAGMAVDIIYASPMLRARETAEIINRVVDVPLCFDDRLIERCFGDCEGKPYAGQLSNAAFIQGGGESLAVLHERVLCFLEEIADRHAGQTVLVVAHGGVGRMVQYCYHGERTIRIENGERVKFSGELLGRIPPVR